MGKGGLQLRKKGLSLANNNPYIHIYIDAYQCTLFEM